MPPYLMPHHVMLFYRLTKSLIDEIDDLLKTQIVLGDACRRVPNCLHSSFDCRKSREITRAGIEHSVAAPQVHMAPGAPTPYPNVMQLPETLVRIPFGN